MKKKVKVVAAVIENENQEILCALSINKFTTTYTNKHINKSRDVRVTRSRLLSFD